jgi:hypothetical protein
MLALVVDKSLRKLSFEINGSYLHTEIGTASISTTLLVSNIAPTVAKPQNLRYYGLALSSDGTWI